jgi:1,4-dihydroxy-2-naphthoate polyprenyltransferase
MTGFFSTHSYRFIRGVWHLSDPKIWTASLVPFLLGTAIAYSHGIPILWDLVVASVVVLILIEVGKNGINEYFDYKSGADLYVTAENRTPFSGGKKVIIDGFLSLRQVGLISVVCLTAAIVAAIPILQRKPGMLIFGMTGVILALAYSVPPFHLSYRGLGELAVGFTFGPVIVNGAYYLQTNSLHREPILLSISMALLIANVLWINEVPDVEADRRAQKWNLVARLGRNRAVPGFILLFALAFLWIVFSSLLLKRYGYLLALFCALLVPGTVRCAKKNILNSQELMPANGRTILIYLLTGLTLAASSILLP